MKTHDLKVWKRYFEALLSGEKTFEFRKNDRGYQKGDILFLHEFDPDKPRTISDTQRFTGRTVSVEITYVMAGKAPFPQAHDLEDWVILAIEIKDSTP